MSDIKYAQSLIHSSLYDTIAEIWADELNETSPPVTQSGGVTTINYTRFDTLPSYWAGEPEADAGVFVSIQETSDLWSDIQDILGDTTKNGYEAYFEDVAQISFVESEQSTAVGAITFAQFDPDELSETIPEATNWSAYAIAPWDSVSDARQQSDIFINDDVPSANPGFVGFLATLHEVGHALGLDHALEVAIPPGEYNAKYTVMIESTIDTQYRHPDMYYGPNDSAELYVLSLQLYDIAALQSIYGANTSTRAGDTTYKIGQGFSNSASTPFLYTIWDGGSTDTIDAVGFFEGVQIDLREGHFSSIGRDGNGSAIAFDSGGEDKGNVAIAFGTVIENAKGTQWDDSLIGNATANDLDGSGGDDTITGGAGADNLDGGAGTDVLDYGQEGGTRGVDGDLSNDTIIDSFGDTDTIDNFEQLTLTDFNDTILVNSTSTPSFGGFAQLNGGAGNDTFVFEVPAANEGISVDGGAGDHDRVTINADEADFSTSTVGNYTVYTYDTNNGEIRVHDSVEDVVFAFTPDVAFAGAVIASLAYNRFDHTLYENAGGEVSDFPTFQASDTLNDEDGWIFGQAGLSTGSVNLDWYDAGLLDQVEGQIQDRLTITRSDADPETVTEITFKISETASGFFSTDSGSGESKHQLFYRYIGFDSDDLTLDAQQSSLDVDPNGFTPGNSQPYGAATLYPGDVNTETVVFTFTGTTATLDFAMGWYFESSGTSSDPGYGHFRGTIELIGLPANTTYTSDSGVFGTSDPDDAAGVLLVGSASDDTITGADFAEIIRGDDGNDTLIGGAGDDILDGGSGTDTADYSDDISGVTVDLAAGTATGTDIGTDSLASIEDVVGGTGDDTLTGDFRDNDLDGGSGTDTVDYSDDTVGVDVDLASGTATGGAIGTDTLTSIEDAVGGDGDDTFAGTSGNNDFDGGDGSDTVDYSADTTDLTVNLATGTASSTGSGSDTLTAIENVIGGAGNDSFTGTSSDNAIDGGSGTDTASYANAASGVTVDLSITVAQNTGGAGSDTLTNIENLTGSAFNDTLSGNSGNNVLNGGAGADTADYSDGATDLTIDLAAGTASSTSSGSDTLQNIENVTAGSGDDSIAGDAADNTIDGGAGIDLVDYSASTADLTIDLFTSSASGTGIGTDTLTNIENVLGGGGDDWIRGSAVVNVLNGGAGDDYVSGLALSDTLYGGDGNDIIYGGAKRDVIDGGNGIDEIQYNIGHANGVTVDLLNETANDGTANGDNEELYNIENVLGSAAADTITGDNGANVIEGGDGNDILDGGLGTDTVRFSSAGSAVTVDLANESATGGAGTDEIYNFENILGSSYDDTLIGDSGNNVLDGGAGADTVDYSDDTTDLAVDLAAGTASSTNSGSDTLQNIENITAGSGDDTIAGDAADNTIDGGAGIDLIDYSASTADLTIDLFTSSASGTGIGTDTLTNIENVLGGSGDDWIRGSAVVNVLNGGAGDDYVSGLALSDTLYGGDGNDIIYGGAKRDVIDGGDGIDEVQYNIGHANGVTVDLLNETANDGTANGDNEELYNIENVLGSDYNDTITGDTGANVLRGADGDDALDGGAGNDTLEGGDGLDTLTGGSGTDYFVFESASAFNDIDVMTDFDVSTDNDVIDISDVLDGYFDPMTDTITDFVQITDDGTDSSLFVDTTGTGTFGAGTQIALIEGITGLTDEAALVTSGNLLVA